MLLTVIRKVTGMPLRHPFLHAALGVLSFILGTVALVYLADALWRFLAVAYDPVLASLIIGLAGLIIALLLLLTISLTSGPANQETRTHNTSGPTADQLAAALFQAFTAGREAGQGVRNYSARQ